MLNLRLILLLLCVPTLVLADVAGVHLPLVRDERPLPFDCAACHPQMAQKMLTAAHTHNLPQDDSPLEVRCYLCHVETRRACRFATVRDGEPKYLHNLEIDWPREGRYELRLRSRNTRAEAVLPGQGAILFDTRQKAQGRAEVNPEPEEAGRLQISRVRLLRDEQGGLLRWETNLKADSEAVYWPAGDQEHLPLKDEMTAGRQTCRDCHPADVWVVSHPVGVRLRPEMAGVSLPLGRGREIICATCHDPHGSRQAYLLRQEQDELCRSCHKGY